MGKIIWISNFNITKDGKMCREFVTNMRKKDKEIKDMPARAKEVLEYFQIDESSSAVPIVEILNKMGFKIYQSNLEPDGLSAYIAVDPKFEDVFESNKITCVHDKDNIGHKRFALAHELAHYLFDFNEDESLYYYDTYFSNDGKEKEQKFEEERASKFAANLLMPEDAFRQKFKEYQQLQSKADIVSALARFFLVSATAVLRRFTELGIDGYDNDTER